MSDTNYGMPTLLDMSHASAYALDQINKMKCEDPDIVKQVCNNTVAGTGKKMGGGTCIKWRQDISQRTYPLPSTKYISLCQTDKDCEMGKCGDNGQCVCTSKKDCKYGFDCIEDPENAGTNVCGYEPADVASGHCVFSTEQACLAQGKLPYTCSDKTCTKRPKKDLKNSYTEWHRDENDKNGGKCVLGNFILRQWCENPQSRCTIDKKTSKYPSGCEGSGSEPGVTDVPAFLYDANKSACYMTHDYCKAYAMDYNMEHHKCTTDAKCQEQNPNWYCHTTDQGGFCTGPESECYLPKGAKIAKTMVGKSLFFMFRKGFKSCKKDKNEGFELPQNRPKTDDEYLVETVKMANKEFDGIDQVVGMNGETMYMKRKILLKKDFAGTGINLYLILWKKSGKATVGFIADEVQKKYPSLIEKHYDGRHITIDRDEIGQDTNIKRMYLTIGSKSWMTDIVLSKLKNIKM